MTDIWKNSPRLGKRLDRVEGLLAETLSDPGFPLAEATKRLVFSGGKMLRPAFVIIGSGFGPKGKGPSSEDKIHHIAAAVELIHTASLVHDDIIDDAAIRRGTSTLHTDFGTTNAILAGDWLFSRSFRLVADYADLKSARVLARFVGGICAAEIGQDLGKFGFSTSKRSYLRTIAGKTAALFSLSLHVGASEAKADPLVIQALRRTGYDIGMAFQIIDDILDYESDDKTLRKPVGNDIKEGLCTLPLILALKKDESSLRPLLGKPMDDRKISEILRIVLATGALDEARSIAQRFTARARVEIERLPSCPAKQELMNASEALLQRRY
ncbi:MAG: polyprenyl synthetase family protein [Spirochaetia bacterium]|jgi:heptaprenyl diphosphate synthase|uniref:Heptaprenyl diphosphate synthase component 2 n=1 Tax=bioreactor metagenome TaxID=1076179 RepID=A0A644TTY9_9ZZZZ|nr:polyprenyl synthetase family protein [Spirochaetia bacterium]MDD3820096.1 polyprenyl synthetase family protein [Spirochaetales bacterium]NLX44804.1 polyprenyl synthetase family protein [Treponema sp.]VBB38845.1 putative heptaprenyl diphosphate synthase component 2 [uncultured Spirochaetota bacterium]MCE1209463.1 polyprenyl synthetase family protein [Spirochaetia bacterium]